MQVQKINESFYKISGVPEELHQIKRKFTLKKPNAFFDPMIKRGFVSDSEVFYAVLDNDIILPTGLMDFVQNIRTEPDYSEKEIKNFIDTLELPFKLYDYQEKMIIESIMNKMQLCLAATGSGKSLVCFCIVSFLMSKGLKGLILVPSISLTTQLLNDFKDYGASTEFTDSIRLIGGDHKVKKFDKPLVISTWQSAMRITSGIDKLDFILVDEAHGLKNDNKSTDIVQRAVKARYRIGLTGTLPEDAISKMAIMSCVGKPKRYIRTQGLIERGLATPVHINILHLKHNNEAKSLFRYVGNHAKKLQFVKENQNRNALISKISNKIVENGNTIVLCSHIQHMKDIYTEIMKQKYPEITLENKHITGKKAFDFQDQYNIYYIAGATKPKDREKIFEVLKNNTNCILISNYAIMSTGLNIKTLKNIVFASPLKSYVTITQSIGRAIRKHVSKCTAEIWDFVDDFSARGNSGSFYKQYLNRLNLSYAPEGFPLSERIIHV